MKCEFPLIADLSKLSGTISEIVGKVNSTMADWGFHEKVTLTGEIGVVSFNVVGEMHISDLHKIRRDIEELMNSKLVDFQISVGPHRLV